MATIRVGVRRIGRNTGFDVPDVGAPGPEVQQHWIEVNGVRIDGGELGLMEVTYGLGRTRPLRDDDGQLLYNDQHQVVTDGDPVEGEVIIRLSCESFATADYREPPQVQLRLHVPGDADSATELVGL